MEVTEKAGRQSEHWTDVQIAAQCGRGKRKWIGGRISAQSAGRMHSHTERGNDQSSRSGPTLMAHEPASSRLKPVPLKAARVASEIGGGHTGLFPAEAGPTRQAVDLLLIFIHKRLSHRQSRLGCRLSAGLAPWAERHGCRESRPRHGWRMAAGPRSETGVKEPRGTRGQTRSKHPWLLGVLFQVTRRRRNSLPPGRRP